MMEFFTSMVDTSVQNTVQLARFQNTDEMQLDFCSKVAKAKERGKEIHFFLMQFCFH